MKKTTCTIFAASLIAIAVSCSKEKINPTQTGSGPETSSTANAKFADTKESFTNEDYFLGIFFLKGAVTDEVKALIDLKSNLANGELTQLGNRGDNMVIFLNQNVPGFFANFGKQIRTGDHQNVNAAIDYAMKTMAEFGVQNGEGPNVEALEADGKRRRNCHKWLIINNFMILRKLDELSDNTGNIQAPSVLLDREILVNDIVKSFAGL